MSKKHSKVANRINRKINTWMLFGVLIALVLLLALASRAIVAAEADHIEAEQGYMYCSSIDNKQPVLLQGEWEYYENQVLFANDFGLDGKALNGSEPEYVQVPGLAPNERGFGTYRLRFEAISFSDMFAIKTTDIWSSARVYLDGKLICAIGDPSTLSVASLPWNSSVYVTFSMDVFRRVHELIVQVSNYDYYMQGITGPIQFGTQMMVYNQSNNVRLIESVCIMGLFILAVLALCMKMLRINLGSIISLMGLSAFFGLNLLMSGEKLILNIFPNMNYVLFTRIYLCTLLLMSVCMGLYVCEFGESGRTALHLSRWGVGASAAALAVLCVVPQPQLKALVYLCAAIAVGWMLASLVFMLLRLKRRETGCFFQILAFISWVYALLIPLGYSRGLIGTTVRTRLLCACVLTFVVFQLIYVAKRVSYIYSGNERLAQRMLISDKLKSELMAIVSHELRTPLHGFINITQSVITELERAGGETELVQAGELSAAVGLARRMSGIVGDLYDFVEENYEEDVQLNPVNVRVEVNAVFELFQYTSRNPAIHFVNQVGASGLTVYADENKLWQILSNLVSNSVKYTREGAITIDARRQGNNVVISVTDTGIGMAQDMQDRIFERYTRLSAGDMNAPGSGLGLYIARKLVTEMHGTIGVTWSEPGRGTCISFTLQACDDKAFSEGHSVQKELALPGAGGEAGEFLLSVRPDHACILVADDNPTNLKIISRMFADCNFTMDMAVDGKQAVKLSQQNPGKYDLVILDVMMPNMNGFEACRTIRQQYTALDLPILMLTARDLTKDIVTGFWAGANDYVTKPADSMELRARVFTLIKLKQAARVAIDSELAFLQAQIKPHFLYNAFNTISAVALTSGEAASELIDDLGVYLRSTFLGSREDTLIPLAQELDTIDAFVHIQKARFGGKIEYSADIAAPQDITLPPLIIQPLVENAIRYGTMWNANVTHIQLSIRIDGGELVITVEDDGPGFEITKRGQADGFGVGLNNINRRLKLRYDREVSISDAQPSGTRAVIRIPLEIKGK